MVFYKDGQIIVWLLNTTVKARQVFGITNYDAASITTHFP